MGVNKKFLPIKGHYFLVNAGTSPIMPFQTVIAKDLGLSAFVTSIIFTSITLGALILKPLVGAIADKFEKQKAIFLILIIIQGVCFFSNKWASPLPFDYSVQLTCSDEFIVSFCSEKIQNCFIKDIQNEFNNSDIHCKLSCPNDFVQQITQLNSSESIITYNTTLKSTSVSLKDICVSFEAEIEDLYPKCTKTIFSTCQMDCESSTLVTALIKPLVQDKDVVGYYQFWFFFVITVIGRIVQTILASFADAICFNILGNRSHLFGKQILWGAVGWGLIAPITSMMIDYKSSGLVHKDYSIAYYASLLFLTLDVLVSSTLEYKVEAVPPNIFKGLKKLIAKPKVFVYMLWCIANGMYHSMIMNFSFWHIEEVAAKSGCGSLAWIKTLEGLMLTFNCYIGEIPLFFLSGWLINKIGHKHCMTIVLLGFGARFLYYSYLVNPWWTLPIEILNGITFGLCYATLTTYASKIAPPGMETSVQNFMCSLYDCLGYAIGSLLGGYLMQSIGSTMTYRVFGLSALILAFLHEPIQYLLRSHEDEPAVYGTNDKLEEKAFYKEAQKMIDTSK